jgi:helicase
LDILKSSLRVVALQKGIAATTGHNSSSMQAAHIRVAKELGAESLVERCYLENGTEYEKAVHDLLAFIKAVTVTVIDDGKRQNVPDLLIKLGDLEALIECKTATKNPALINKEDAWAVVQKATDFAPSLRRITLGKPAFDETSKRKAAASTDLTLVENGLFVEAVLRILQRTLSPKEFMDWITVPGVSQLERLPGEVTYSK